MRSASRTLFAALFVAGCATTQQQAARLQLNSARIRATEMPARLVRLSHQVTVASVAGISDRTGSAVVVTFRNTTAKPVSDLPVLVGIAPRHYLNASPGLSYFQTHVPGIAAHGQLRWVLTTGSRLAPRSVLFARVGIATGDTATKVTTLPSLRVGAGGGLITVQNDSTVPQYQVPVYVLAWRGGRYVAAGHATIAQLDTGARVRLRVPLVGDPLGATLSLEAPPTTFS